MLLHLLTLDVVSGPKPDLQLVTLLFVLQFEMAGTPFVLKRAFGILEVSCGFVMLRDV